MDSYRNFLGRVHDDLAELLRQGEDMEWHHAPGGTAEALLYNRLMTLLDNVQKRMLHYDLTKNRPTPPLFIPQGGR